MTAVAPTTNTLRKALSPALVMGRRLTPGCRLPRLAGGNLVEDADETGYFREDGASDDLMTRNDRKLPRHLQHPGSLERGKESLWKCRLEVQPILSTLTE
jgi:hypothetical protein